MGLKTYEYDGKIYKSHNKEILARRLFKPVINNWGERVWIGLAEKVKLIKKIPKGKKK